MELGKLEITPNEGEQVRRLKQEIRDACGSVKPGQLAGLAMSDAEIRADFAQKLTRTFGDMASSGCTCGVGGVEDHERGCAGQVWAAARRIVALELADATGEEG